MIQASANRLFTPTRGLLEEAGDMVVLTGKTIVSALRSPRDPGDPTTLLLDERALVDVGPAGPQAEAAARRDLRAQIARLEARGATTPAAASGPRLLSLGELETVRDALLSARMSHTTPHEVASGTFEDARLRLERMFAAPREHKWERVTLGQLGRPGCGVYRVRPRLGLVGMLAGWWEITLSSGCP
jgi:hypothetical protein